MNKKYYVVLGLLLTLSVKQTIATEYNDYFEKLVNLVNVNSSIDFHVCSIHFKNEYLEDEETIEKAREISSEYAIEIKEHTEELWSVYFKNLIDLNEALALYKNIIGITVIWDKGD